MPKYLTQDQIDHFNAFGYLTPVDVLTEAEAAEVLAHFEAAEARYPDQIHAEDRNNLHYVLPCFDNLIHHPRVLDAMEDLIGPDILAWTTTLFAKEPKSKGYVSWHQDSAYWGIEPREGITAWFALTHADLESGCMKVLPGSHKDDIRPHSDTFGDDNLLTRGQNIEGIDESQTVAMPLRPGQMSLHHVRTIHGSMPNQADYRRVGLSVQAYMRPEAHQTLGPDHASLMRGHDPYQNFMPGHRPAAEMDAESSAFRAAANQRTADILYAGAEKRRGF